MSATDRSAFVGWLLDYLVGRMAVVAWWVGYMAMPGWLAAWKKVDVANWMQMDLLCFSQIEDNDLLIARFCPNNPTDRKTV